MPDVALSRPEIDWPEFAKTLGDIPHTLEPPLVKQKSRDFYWYSPILKEQLHRTFGDMVVTPRTKEELIKTVSLCAKARIPVTLRGGGTGNYGQAMPLAGGVILETTSLDRILWLKDGVLRVQTGKKLLQQELETIPQGWEMRMHPSTNRTATVGGFVAGGSGGIGSVTHGVLRDRGSILGLEIVTMEEEPRIIELRGDDVLKATHAYGCNGIITEVEMPLTSAIPWVERYVAFDDFMTAVDFCTRIGNADPITKKLLTIVENPIPQDHFKPLKPHLPEGKHIVLALIAANGAEPFGLYVKDFGGEIVFERDFEPEERDGIPPIYEFSWNHTTLQMLKTDRSITYLQTLFAPGIYREKIEHMMQHFGDEVPMHLEFARVEGQLACFGLQIVRYTTPERLQEIIDYHDENDCPIFNPHTFILEDGGMKEVDDAQVAFKQECDPYGLLNPGKMRGWEEKQAEG